MTNPVLLLSDVTANDSDKTFTVPTGSGYRLLYGSAQLATTATVGNRQLEIQIRDESDNVVYFGTAGAVQAASLTRDYFFAQGDLAGRETAFVSDEIVVKIPHDCILLSGWDIRIADTAAVDAAADDLTINLVVEEIQEL